MAPEQYAVWRDDIAVANRVVETIVELSNGRVHEIHHEPTPDGGWVATFDDITERRRTERLMWHMARHDPLTDLPNRHEFREHLEVALGRLSKGARLAVHCIDLDRFKGVNDTLGHGVGDRLLCKVAARIRGRLLHGDIVTRLGGDEFAILQLDIESSEHAERLATAVVDAVRRPYSISNHRVCIGASIGVAVAPLDGADHDTLLSHADSALYRVKRNGRGGHAFFRADHASAA